MTTVVECTVRVREETADEVSRERFLEDVKADLAPVELHDRVRAARGRNPGLCRDLAGDELVQIRAVLKAVVQMEARHTVKALRSLELREADGQPRFPVRSPK